MTTYYLKYTPNSTAGPFANARILTRDKAVVDAVNSSSTVATASGPLFEVSETRRTKGLRPRLVVLARISATTGMRIKTRNVPVLTPSRFSQINLGDAFTINSEEWSVIRKEEEEIGV